MCMCFRPGLMGDFAGEGSCTAMRLSDPLHGRIHACLRIQGSHFKGSFTEVDVACKHVLTCGRTRLQGRLKNDINKLVSERAELQEKVNSLQNQIYKGSEKMDQFKILMNWNQEELEQWALAQRQKEEDNAALEKYKHQVRYHIDVASTWQGSSLCVLENSCILNSCTACAHSCNICSFMQGFICTVFHHMG
jgi:hypothetical protein